MWSYRVIDWYSSLYNKKHYVFFLANNLMIGLTNVSVSFNFVAIVHVIFGDCPNHKASFLSGLLKTTNTRHEIAVHEILLNANAPYVFFRKLIVHGESHDVEAVKRRVKIMTTNEITPRHTPLVAMTTA